MDNKPSNETDHGLLELKSEQELDDQMNELGLQFRYGCFQDKLPMACHSLGQWFESYKKNYVKSAAQFRYNCDTHAFGESCLKFANRRLTGKDKEPDPDLALKYYLKGCEESNHARCCTAAGQLLGSDKTSLGVDLPHALQLYTKACDLGFPGGCWRAGGYHLQGKGMENPNKKMALKFFLKGCEGRNLQSCVNASLMYKNGDGVERNAAKAAEFKEKAREIHKAGFSLAELNPKLPGD